MTGESSRFSLARLFAIVAVLAVVCALIRLGYIQHRRGFDEYETFGAIWQTHDMLILHMRENDGQWPPNWDALEWAFANTNKGYGAPNIEWVKQRVRVDFTFDPSSFRKQRASNGPMAVMSLPDGRSNDEIRDANERIMRYVLGQRPTREGRGDA